MPALGVLLFQTQAGWLLDRWRRPRWSLAVTATLVGLCYVALTWVGPGAHLATFGILFASGVAQSFFAPLLCGLALGLVGHAMLTRTVAWNEAHNHMGEVCSAVIALFIVGSGISAVFYLIGIIAVVAGGSALLIRKDEIDHDLQTGGTENRMGLNKLLLEKRVIVFIVSTSLFQFVISAEVPFAALRVRALQGTNQDVALYILVASLAMVPTAACAGRVIDRFGRRLVFALAFLILPFTLLACVLARTPGELIGVQAMRGVAQGIFGVAIVAVSHDVSRGTGRFQALTGASRAALAGASLLGPLPTGFLIQHGGFNVTFLALTVIAAIGAATFLLFMPETRTQAVASGT